MKEKFYPAPVMPAEFLWSMTENDFNAWRREHDYPRIVNYLRDFLPEFSRWMNEEGVDDSLLINHSPSSFLSPKPKLYLCTRTKTGEQQLIDFHPDRTPDAFNASFITVVPYPTWYRRQMTKDAPKVYITSKRGRSHTLLGGLVLLDLGNVHLVNKHDIGLRLLDFVNISDLRIDNSIGSHPVKLWFCSASNVTIQGDLAFLYAYRTNFYETWNLKTNNLKLYNGRFQSFRFEDCEVHFTASNALIHKWHFKGWDFSANISNTEVQDCVFESSKPRYPIGYGRRKLFHAAVKQLYSQLGKKKEASRHFYLEKNYERKSFLHVRENYQSELIRRKNRISKLLCRIHFRLRYIYSFFLNLFWGYGERPGRVFYISVFTIFMFSALYYFLPQSPGKYYHHYTEALFYSFATFTTLSYGDITSASYVFKILTGTEALLGLSFWGILIAGFTGNAKDY